MNVIQSKSEDIQIRFGEVLCGRLRWAWLCMVTFGKVE